MKQQKFLNFLILVISASTVNGFWWGSSSNQEEEEPVKRIPVHVLRTLTYHPVLIPNNPMAPVPPIAPFQYGRGFLSQYQGNLHQNSNPSLGLNPYAASSNNYNTYQTNPPPTPSSTTHRPTTTTPPQTTTTTSTSSPSTTTTETTTTFQQQQQQDQYSQMTGKFSAKSPMISDRFNQFPYEYSSLSGAQQASAKGPQDPYNLQYVTNIAPMNVQFVPCMCPVEVRINPNEPHPSLLDNKSTEDSILESNINDLDDNLE